VIDKLRYSTIQCVFSCLLLGCKVYQRSRLRGKNHL